MWVPIILYLGATYQLLISGVGGMWGRGIGLFMLIVISIFFWNRLIRIPSVETNEDGIIVYPEMGKERLFVKWADMHEVVIWYYHTGTRITAIGIRCDPEFVYDNYGQYPALTPNVVGEWGYIKAPRGVDETLHKWSVSAGPTKARPVAALVNAARKGVKVTEIDYSTRRPRDLTSKS